jgi:hypothetical protein
MKPREKAFRLLCTSPAPVWSRPFLLTTRFSVVGLADVYNQDVIITRCSGYY